MGYCTAEAKDKICVLINDYTDDICRKMMAICEMCIIGAGK